jgi:hypothetical protein
VFDIELGSHSLRFEARMDDSHSAEVEQTLQGCNPAAFYSKRSPSFVRLQKSTSFRVRRGRVFSTFCSKCCIELNARNASCKATGLPPSICSFVDIAKTWACSMFRYAVLLHCSMHDHDCCLRWLYRKLREISARRPPQPLNPLAQDGRPLQAKRTSNLPGS